MFQHAYKRFLEADPDRLHFAAHSHHYWPDCTRDAQLACWDDAARLTDRKWEHVFGSIIPKAQAHIARHLGLSQPQSLVFAPNTHELITRLLSCFEQNRPLRILTTDSEFHSFTRQLARYEELPNVKVERISTEPFKDFASRFIAQAERGDYDLVFVSQVFFNSGFVFDQTKELVDRLRATKTVIVIDGYHAFCAIPVDLKAIEDRVFYLAGGYKYAQAGEGACFMHVPAGCELRPLDTGWFAGFSQLKSSRSDQVQYAADGSRFWGSTFDPSGLYRLNAVMDWWQRDGVTIEVIHQHIRKLQTHFLKLLDEANLKLINRGNLMNGNQLDKQGHFLTFKTNEAQRLHDELLTRHVIVDYRGDRLRFGFGLYHELSTVEQLIKRLA